MAKTIVEFTDPGSASLVEEQLPSGVYNVKFYVTEYPDANLLGEIKTALVSGGADVKGVYKGSDANGKYVSVTYQRIIYEQGISQMPLAIIGLIGSALVPILIGIGIFKIGDISTALVKLLLVGGGIAVVLAIVMKEPIAKYADKKLR